MPDKDDEIKSALDIAMARAQRLGVPSNEEKQQVKKEKLATAGEALVKRYLNGLPLRDLLIELSKHTGEDRDKVKQHLQSRLLDNIDIRPGTANDRILEAIQQLTGDSGITQAIVGLIQEYGSALERARQEKLGALEAAKLDELKLKGISGSAIEPAIESSPEWQKMQQVLESRYRERLEELKHTQ